MFWGESLLEEQLERAGWGAGAHLRHRHPGLDGVRQRHKNPGDAAGSEAAEDTAALEVSRGRGRSKGCRMCMPKVGLSIHAREGADETRAQRLSPVSSRPPAAPQTMTVCRSSELQELWALAVF